MSASLEGSIKNLVDKRTLKWIFVGGKGGVGKTTTSCSLSIALSKTRKSVLLVSTDPAHNLSDAFAQKFSNQPTLVSGFENLYAMEVEPPQQAAPDAAAGEATEPVSEAVLNDPFSASASDVANDMFGDVGSALPGIDEAMAFGTLMKSVREMDHDVVVFDTAPTGHTMRLLGFPNLLEKGLSLFRSLIDRFGPMASSMAATMGMTGLDVPQMVERIEGMRGATREVSDLFADPAKCTFVCVCIPEFLSVFETERLVQEVDKFDISVNNIIVNQIIRDDDISNQEKGEHLYRARMAMQTKYLEQVVELYGEDFHITCMPLLSDEVRGKAALEQYSNLILTEKKEFTDGMDGMNDIGEYQGSLNNLLTDNALRWVFVGGKGGVGKTTTSSAIGVAFEKKGLKVLLVSTDPAHNLSDAFGQKISSGTEPTKIDGYKSLFAMEVNATEVAQDFVTKMDAMTDRGPDQSNMMAELLPTDTLRQIFSSIPGIDEAVSFMQIVKLARSMSFDKIVFDTAPTGHTLRLLEFPRVAEKAFAKLDNLRQKITPMLSMMSSGDNNLQDNIRRAEEELEKWKSGLAEVTKVLNDQERTTFVCVAIAEFLSVYETERLVQQLCELNINVRNILVNQLMSPKQKDIFGALQARSQMQKKYLEQVDELYPREDFFITYMPLLPMEVRGLPALREYGDIAIAGGTTVKRPDA